MGQNDSNQMTPFDQLLSSESLQMMKLLIPYMPPKNQRFLGVYVKFLELQQTINFFKNINSSVYAQDFHKKKISVLDILEDIRPFLPSHLTELLENLTSMMNMLEMMQTMSEMQGNTNQTNSNSDFDPMAMMKHMLTPEQQDMFEMYNTMFSPENNMNKKEGDDPND